MTRASETVVQKICQTIYDKKGLNPVALFVGDISSMTDYLVVAEGNVDRHVIAIANDVVKELKKEGLTPLHLEGMQSGDWVLIDYSDIIVHIFMPGLREKYQLERLFSRGEIVPVKFSPSTV